MEVGISTASFFTKFPTEETFEIIKNLGFNICEVFLTTFREYTPQFVSLFKEKLDGIKVFSIHTLNQQFEPELFNIMARTREDCEVFFTQVAYAASELNANYYTFHGPAKLKKRKYTHNYPWIAERLEHLNKILFDCTDGRCELAYENVHWTYFSEPEFFGELKRLSPIKGCLDIKQAKQSGIDVYDYIKVMGDRIVNVHVCDYDEEGNLKLPGQGTFDFIKLCSSLISINYNGPLIIEVYANNYNNLDEIIVSKQYLEYCINTAKKMSKSNN